MAAKRLRITKIDECQFLTCVKHQVWGSQMARFKTWQEGDYLAFIVDKGIAGVAQVPGKPFFSKQSVWDNGTFPHRLGLKFVAILPMGHSRPFLGRSGML
jgi:hypothetical protein